MEIICYDQRSNKWPSTKEENQVKRIRLLIVILLIASVLSGCVEKQVEISASVSPAGDPTASQTPEPSLAGTALPSSAQSSVSPSNTETKTKTPVIIDAPLPDLQGTDWYDWDRVGTYPGASVVQCGDKIAFQMIHGGEELAYISYLSFANPDGSNYVQTEIANSSNLNYKDGWVYFIYKDNCIYKVKTDGSELTEIFKATNPEGTAQVWLSDLLLVDDKMYVFENIENGENEKSIFKRISLDGTNFEELDEFDSFGYSKSLFYDSGKLYYISANLDRDISVLYQYDIAANNLTCLTQDLPTDYSKIAVRGDKVYHERDWAPYVYTISTCTDEPLISADFVVYDFGIFDRWLLMTGDDGIYFYELQTGKLYYGCEFGNAVSIVPTQNYVYLEEIDDWPILWPLIIQNGSVTVGEVFNLIYNQ